MSSFHTGATHFGSYALSDLASKARPGGGAAPRRGALGGAPVITSEARDLDFLALEPFFAATFFASRLAGGLNAPFAFLFSAFPFLRIVFRMLPVERPATSGTMNRARFRNHVVELAPATACRFESIMPAVDAVVVVRRIRAEACTHRAALCDGRSHG